MIAPHLIDSELSTLISKLADHRDRIKLGHALDAVAADLERGCDRVLNRLHGLERRLAEVEHAPPWQLLGCAVRAATKLAKLTEAERLADLEDAIACQDWLRLTEHRLLRPGTETDLAVLRGVEGADTVHDVLRGLASVARARGRLAAFRAAVRELPEPCTPESVLRLRELLKHAVEPKWDTFWPAWSAQADKRGLAG